MNSMTTRILAISLVTAVGLATQVHGGSERRRRQPVNSDSTIAAQAVTNATTRTSPDGPAVAVDDVTNTAALARDAVNYDAIIEEGRWREWTLAGGQRGRQAPVYARLLSVDGKLLTLMLTNNTSVIVSVSDLSGYDQQYLARFQGAQRSSSGEVSVKDATAGGEKAVAQSSNRSSEPLNPRTVQYLETLRAQQAGQLQDAQERMEYERRQMQYRINQMRINNGLAPDPYE